ncbi:c-di-GMP phosphodiesterase [Lysinibacillus sp. KCTC 33748]|uniref:HD-GYP domain-containing protein n=1 Tax=unclassified Lysinibacillus TaxID=2636778 RepID=UPI0009A6BDC3|nr:MULTISPECIES: HD-GYP domain-containing protein [unclassified Lysinibacillus]OXS68284.1 c-di-GMP phosphodiesterase [Lysinibacillus sp. KCTC 33748]SKC12046.1 HD-GYP domain, c-di-GMP phosphodiesterase class II (or its inactivated variant) [Lysinibacillus sp. AC-3]
METIHVPISELRIGKVISEDIFANTQHPIIFKNTIISHEHFQVFFAFNISRVPVYKEGVETQSEVKETGLVVPTEPIPTFRKIYDNSVEQFKKEFKNWEAGAKVDIAKARKIILPLLEMVLEDRTIIFDLNEYSNPKDYLYHHCVATALISSVIAQKLSYDKGITIQVAIGGLLADCGMAKVHPRIRDKKTTLTEQEFNEIYKHPIYSYSMVKDVTILKDTMKEAIFQHHERLNGSGYPKGEKIANISTFAQIIAVADVFHAMTCERVYRTKQSSFKVIEMINESEFGKFDIKVVRALIDIVADLPIGTIVELSNLEQGEVMFVNKFAPTRPLIKLSQSGEIFDLGKNRTFYISRIITNL